METVLGESANTRETSRETRKTAARSRHIGGQRGTLVRQAIGLVVHYPAEAGSITAPPELAQATQRGVALVLELLEICRQSPQITSAMLLERFRDRPEKPHLEQLLSEEMLVSEQAAARVLGDNLARIVNDAKQQRLAELVAKMAEGSLSPEEKSEFLQLRKIDANMDNSA